MEEERGVHRLADDVVPPVRERDVTDAAAGLGLGEPLLQLPDGPDELDGVIVVLFQAGADGQDIAVKNDITGVEADLLGQELVRQLANGDLVVLLDRLTLWHAGDGPLRDERHDDHGRTVALDEPGPFEELLFTPSFRLMELTIDFP